MERIKKYEPLWGEWRATRKIGEGSFGAVYEVERTIMGNTSRSAVKLISFQNVEILQGVKTDETMSAEQLDAIKLEVAKKNVREATLMDRLQGRANIVTIYDYKIYPNEKTTDVIIRMELLENLRDYTKTVQVDTNLVIKLGLDICKALESCEKEKIIHRDIKPDNIFINKDGDFKLGDFGLSRQMNKSASMSLRKSKGTPLYMPPEAFGWDSGVDNTSDIYSLGLVMYQLLNDGKIPFCNNMDDFDDIDRAIGKRINSKEDLPIPKRCPERLGAILRKACGSEKKDRYYSATEMRKELLNLRDELDGNATVLVSNEDKNEKDNNGKSSKNKIVLLAAVLVAALGVGIFLAGQLRSSEDTKTSGVLKTVESAKTNEEQPKTEQTLNPSIQYEKGDTFTLGSYPQDTSSEEDKQPIEWIVLKKEEDKMLVASKYVLDGRQYHREDEEVTWESSSIRRWLNQDFYDVAFDDSEQEYILEMTVKAENNTKYGTEAGEDTKDKIFLLSITEAEKLFSSNEKRKCSPTEYAVSHGVWKNEETGDGCCWWLRAPGYNTYLAAGVYGNGYAFHVGINVYHFKSGVRPAMWVTTK